MSSFNGTLGRVDVTSLTMAALLSKIKPGSNADEILDALALWSVLVLWYRCLFLCDCSAVVAAAEFVGITPWL